MLLYYITDRRQLPGDEAAQRAGVLAKIAEAARSNVDFIQLRERDLPTRDLESLSREAVEAVRVHSSKSKLLINSRSDVVIACGADGVHLRSDDIAVSHVREVWKRVKAPNPIIGISCHSSREVARAASEGADFAVFAPVFEKRNAPDTPATGIDGLSEACCNNFPVLALGGVTLENARACLDAGAAGVAGIRLFQENDIETIVRALRG